ncbi:MAG: DNA polymerase III subunit alpha [Candidatus Gracilibacteria bacterium]|nr:DNA polymerase III subunit alpha [Candidatus Gracilibacteria bacterium]
MSFVHLHTHTHYSFLSGLGKPGAFVKRTKELSMPGLAITDAGNLYGAFEFYKKAKESGVNPIIGVEATISKKGKTNRDKDNELFEIVLLAKNIEGYKNLINMVTESWLHGMYNGRPRIDFELLEKYKGHLIGLSGSIMGEIPQHITTGKSEEYIRQRIAYYEGIFGKDDFYLELQEHPDRGNQPKINDYLIKLSRTYGHKVVATNHVYYIDQSDAEARDLFYCIGDGRSLEDPDRPTLIEGNYALRSGEEMAELFAHVPEAIRNTLEINDKIRIDIPYGETLIPTFELGEKEKVLYREYTDRLPVGIKKLGEEEWNLRYICISGLNFRYNFGLDEITINEFIHKKDISGTLKKLMEMSVDELKDLAWSYYTDRKKEMITELEKKLSSRNMLFSASEIIDRLEYELVVVDLMGFNGYFNIVSDFIIYAKNNGVPVGPGRGSAAGAILAYLSNITDIDPLPYGLLFERFLNPSRVSMPDIDVDFSDTGRDKVISYVREKYGADHVAQICTFGTMAARAAVKDVGKALGIPFAEMNKLAASIPSKPGTKLKDALEESIEFKKAYDTDSRYHMVIDNALRLEGSIRQLGVHACAVIIAPKPMTDYCSLQHPPKDEHTTVTQFSAGPLEDLGLLKMDFLGLRNLTIIERCLKIIKSHHGKDLNILDITFDDKKVFKVFADGDTTGVFQLESAGMRKYLRDLKPNVFEDIIAMLSLYRPGPIAYIPTYIARKHGREKVAYPHPSLEAILKPTQGIAIYQEQIMQLVQAFAGFSLGEADILRRAIGKKKIDLLMEQKGKFIDAAKAQGHKEELAKYIFEDIIEPFAGYGFNKSHAACYAMISYQTAYLKAYYPTEFMTALMVSDEEDMERITMEIGECRSKGIEILPPDVNESMKHFTFIDKKHIRFGLKAIKGLGDGPIDSIRRNREGSPYTTIYEFIERNSGDVINKKALEALILSGALDSLGDRASLVASITKMSAIQKENEKKQATSQIGLFDLGHHNTEHLRFSLEKAKALTFEEKIRGEKQSIGYGVSGHGLDGLKPYIDKRTIGMEHIALWRKKMSERVVMEMEHEGDVEENVGANLSVRSENISQPLSLPEGEEVINDKRTGTPAKTKKEAMKRVRLIGLVTSVRQVQTKTGKMMAIATCDSFDFKFTVLVFSKEYEVLSPLLEEDKILLVEGIFRGNEENGEMAVTAQTIRASTITSIRQQANDVNLFDARTLVNLSGFTEEVGENTESGTSEIKESLPMETDLQETEEEDIGVNPCVRTKEHVITVPSSACRQDLVDLKTYLEGLTKGSIQIYIDIQGQKKDTKISVESIGVIKEWVAAKGW